MKYFLDTEFIEDGHTIDLISIGIVSEDDRELYCESALIPWHRADPWVIENVKPHLLNNDPLLSYEIRDKVLEFCDPEKYGKPEFWGYYADAHHGKTNAG